MEYLVGIMYHEPESYELWNKGIIEDYESSTAIFISADSETDAIAWGKIIADKLFKNSNPIELKSWADFEYHCWIEDVKNSSWKHCFSFFQRVNAGELPDLNKMGSDAYAQWQKAKFN